MKVVTCPGCSVRIKVADGKHGRFACPKCGQTLLIKPPAGASGSPAPAQRPASAPQQPADPLSNPLSDPLAVPNVPTQPALPNVGAFPRMQTTGIGGLPNRPTATARRGQATSGLPLKGFLIRLAIVHAIIAGVMLLMTLVGLLSEPLAMGASVVAIICTLGLLFTGRIWMIVIAFQETAVQGLLVLLVPYYWLIYMVTRKGRAIQAFSVLASTLIPALLALAMVAVFMARYEGGSPRARSSPFLSPSRRAVTEKRIADMKITAPVLPPPVVTTPAEPVLQTVSFPIFSQGSVDLPKADQALNAVAGYVAGSVRADAQQGTITLQYYGSEVMATQYGLALSSSAGIMVRVKPTFIKEAATGGP